MLSQSLRERRRGMLLATSIENTLVRVENLVKYFPVQKSLVSQIFSRDREYVHAVDSVSFSIEKGKIHTLVGESGSGKTTTGKITVGLIEPTSGNVFLEGKNIFREEIHRKELRKKAQYIFQDPNSSLNPRIRVGYAIEEPLIHLTDMTKQERRSKVLNILEEVNLSPAESFYSRFPHELSGGQRQRVVIARALVVEPSYVVADEPVAMVDASVRAQIMDLLLNMQKRLSLTILLITHDLAVASYMADTISVMYLGRIVEHGSVEQIFSNPLHPYTKALISSVPIPDPKVKREKKIPQGEIPSAIKPPPGCRFNPRCPYSFDRCRVEEPKLIEVEPGHLVSCFLYP
jgi:peptide/nickel transport system ATP-binding protein